MVDAGIMAVQRRNLNWFEPNGIKKNYFYHTTPSMSDESGDEEQEEDLTDSVWDESWSQQVVVKPQCLPCIWFCEDTFFHPCQSSRDQGNSAGSSDSEEQNYQAMARLRSREPVPKSEDEACYGNTSPRIPSHVRFAEEPVEIYYDQVTEYEPDVFDFKFAMLENLRKECAKNGSPFNRCFDDDDDFEETGIVEFVTETLPVDYVELNFPYYYKHCSNSEPLKVIS